MEGAEITKPYIKVGLLGSKNSNTENGTVLIKVKGPKNPENCIGGFLTSLERVLLWFTLPDE